MSLSSHHQRRLYRIEAGLLQANPQLAALPGIFGKLAVGQDMPAWEQTPTRGDRIQQTSALTARAITFAAVGLPLSTIPTLLIVDT
jgi:hypothetical protein